MSEAIVAENVEKWRLGSENCGSFASIRDESKSRNKSSIVLLTLLSLTKIFHMLADD